MDTFEVVVRFRPGGPAVTGEWTSRESADRKFRSWIGLYGDHETAVITLSLSSADGSQVLKTWTKQHGETTSSP
ncbi:hypothetical protein ABT126_42920 [Streptomyces sp. NPDC002012]|uniref:hypothetical protein n=1 Tax=Streptomyces sp. NPDC002012 TaxID=3154532 RepID=UPI0033193BC3